MDEVTERRVDRHMRWIAAVALIAAGCTRGGAGLVPVQTAAAARPATGGVPHTYYLAIRNQLKDRLRFTLTPAKDVTYKGKTSFALAPREVVTGYFTLSTVVHGLLLDVEANDVTARQTVHQELSIAGSSLVCAMRVQRDSGIAEYAEISRIGTTSAKIVIADETATSPMEQRHRLSDAASTSEYRVTLDNALSTEALHVTVMPGKDTILKGSSAFALDPSASKTVLLAQPDDVQRTDVTLEYDGFQDFPRYPIGVFTDLNAVMASMYVHFEPNANQTVRLQAQAFHDLFVATAGVSGLR
jgi:hypothetical protein